MSFDAIQIEQAHGSHAYGLRPFVIVRGQGAALWDQEGNAYIDCVGGHGVAVVGHAHPHIVQAISEQAGRLIVCPATFPNDIRARFLERLVAVAPTGLDHLFLSNSGTEAVEAALKFARLATSRTEIVAAMRGFHGRTFGALSATWNKKYRQPFLPLVPGFRHVPFNKLAPLQAAVGEQTAAVLLEVVQGEGGVNPARPDYLAGVREICDRAGALLIVDEVQTGFGRTGKLFAVEHFGLRPDLMTLAKGIAGGVPMGATLMRASVAEKIRPGVHGSTFGGNPLAAAAAIATLDVLAEEDLPRQAAEKGEYLLAALRDLPSPIIRQVRGLGLMIGIELTRRSTPYLQQLMLQHRVLALPAGGNVIRLLPPLVITYEQIDRVIVALRTVLST